MLETHLTSKAIGTVEVRGPAWFTLDPVTLQDLQGSSPTVTATSTSVDNDFLIDGKPSRVVPANVALTVGLQNAFDMTIPEWTIEWSGRMDNALNNYAYLLQVLTNANAPGFFMRQSDAGFGNRLHASPNPGAINSWYALPFSSTTRLGVLINYALVKRDGLISFYIDKVLTKLAIGQGGTYNQPGIPVGAGQQVATNNRIIIGGQGVGQHIGELRISKFARYYQG